MELDSRTQQSGKQTPSRRLTVKAGQAGRLLGSGHGGKLISTGLIPGGLSSLMKPG
jgi:hypothetical protein